MKWHYKLVDVPIDRVIDAGGVIIREESISGEKKYNRFAGVSITSLVRLLYDAKTLIGHRIYHELATSSGPQRIRFDVETTDANLRDKINEKYGKGEVGIHRALGNAICAHFHDFLSVNLTCNRPVMISKRVYGMRIHGDISLYLVCLISSGKTKFSAHYVLSGICVPNVVAIRYVANGIINRLDTIDRALFDMGIYTRNHSLRIVGCKKNSRCMGDVEPSVKLLRRTLVSYTANDVNMCTYNVQLPEEDEVKQSHADISDLPASAADAILEDVQGAYQVRDVIKIDQDEDNLWEVRVDRLEPTHCPLCDRVHSSEHPYYRVRMTSSHITVVWNCRRTIGWHPIYKEVRGPKYKDPHGFSRALYLYMQTGSKQQQIKQDGVVM